MSQGYPLTDEDRWDWLQRICETSLAAASPPTDPPEELGGREPLPPGCITTCSALKKAYRDLLRDHLSRPGVAVLNIVFLTASEEVLLQRIEERKNHYMKSNMVRSQIVTAEVPRMGNDDGGNEEDEREVEADCKVIWTDELTPDEVADRSIEVVREMMVNDIEEEDRAAGTAADDEKGEVDAEE
ncbi:hypothetical protein ABW19_dt0201991 [Dactylella cylindrospora]|nr:hypothetical protein ABW19_dt0201991 [Dactylella cylindrospora]